MGQSNGKNYLSSKSSNYFLQQVNIFKWRADKLTNSHISQVFFTQKKDVSNKQKLKALLENQFSNKQFIQISEILRLSETDVEIEQKDQYMSFENYYSDLTIFQHSLNLEENLYVLQSLFSGYESIFNKMRKTIVDSKCIFVTDTGQIRVWLNKDYTSNEINQQNKDWRQSYVQTQFLKQKSNLLLNQMSIIRASLQITQKLASNHTTYLHFSKQFKLFMERDTLHNWNFSNARKLINGYVYAYKMHMPVSLKDAIIRLEKKNIKKYQNNLNLQENKSSIYQSDQDEMCSNQFISTGFTRAQNQKANKKSNKMIENTKLNSQRPLSFSEHSEQKSVQFYVPPNRLHQKKLSSTDLKNYHEKQKSQHVVKNLSKSQFLTKKLKPDESYHKQNISASNSINFKYINNKSETNSEKGSKRQNFARYQNLIQNNNLSKYQPIFKSLQQVNSQVYESSINFTPQKKYERNQDIPSISNIAKFNQKGKQKKKLQKKVATISKYISYYQNEKQDTQMVKFSDQIVYQKSQYNQSNHNSFDKLHSKNMSKQNNEISIHISTPPVQLKRQTQQRTACKTTKQNILSPKAFNSSNQFTKIPKKQQQSNPYRSHLEKKQVELSVQSHDSTDKRNCYTIKTINHLLSNSEVSVHESNGSFQSLQNSKVSEYDGILTKMGRSVNAGIKFVSKKDIQLKKNNSNHMNFLQ